MIRQPLIDEMVAFIESNQPNEIEKIRSSNPNFKDILKLGSMLGESDSSDELKVRAKVCFSALETIISTCEKTLPNLKSKLKNSQKFQLWGQIIATISSASVITTLATDHKNITYVAGALSLLGSLVPLIVDYLKKGIDSTRQLDENYMELIKMKLEAEQNIKELNFFITNNFNVDGISEVINKSNQLCSDISIRLATC